MKKASLVGSLFSYPKRGFLLELFEVEVGGLVGLLPIKRYPA